MTTLLDLMGEQPQPSWNRRRKGGAIAAFVKMSGPQEDALTVARSRLKFAGAIYLLVLGIFGWRLTDITLVNLEDSGRSYEVKRQAITAFNRADILDRNGVLLATNLSTSSVYADPSEIPDADEAATALRTVFPQLAYEDLIKAFSHKGRFAWIKRNITPEEQYQVNILGIPGIHFKREEQRIYPHGRLFSHVLGFVNIDNQGSGGLERSLNSLLGKAETEENGLTTALDSRIQYVFHDELSKAITHFKAKAGVGMLMHAKTGEMLAMVSLPDFDPHHPADANDDQRFNRASLGTYEMGSTFKMLTFAMALESGNLRLDEFFDVSKPFHYARHVIRDSHPEHRPLSGMEVFTHSSNIGTVKIASRVGVDYQQKFLRNMGLFHPVSEIELSERGIPLKPAQWKEIQSLTISFGHGMSVTPLHLLRAMNTLVTDGKIHPVSLLRQSEARTISPEAVISQGTIDKMRLLLRHTVAEGTGRKAEVEGYAVGGKTGTAEKVVNGRYHKKALLNSFISAFPIHDPHYIMLVMLDEPQGLKETWNFATAGWNVVPTSGKILARIGPMLEMQPVEDSIMNAYRAKIGEAGGGMRKSHAAE